MTRTARLRIPGPRTAQFAPYAQRMAEGIAAEQAMRVVSEPRYVGTEEVQGVPLAPASYVYHVYECEMAWPNRMDILAEQET